MTNIKMGNNIMHTPTPEIKNKDIEYPIINDSSQFDTHYKKVLDYEIQGDYNNYFVHLVSLADRNYELAKKRVMNDYIVGKNNHQDHNVTIKFYEENKQYAYAAGYLGWFHNSDYCLEKNPEKTIELYKHAIALNNPCAMHNLAIIYLNGLYATQDTKKAIELLTVSTTFDNSASVNYLGNMYRAGKIVEQNDRTAINFYLKSINMGNTEALTLLYNLYKHKKSEYKTEAFEYFLSIGNIEYASKFCDGDDYIELYQTHKLLQKEYDHLLEHIKASPDGELFLEAMADWKSKVKN